MERKTAWLQLMLSVATTLVAFGVSYGVTTANLSNESREREKLEVRLDRHEATDNSKDVAVLKSQMDSMKTTINKIADRLGVVPNP